MVMRSAFLITCFVLAPLWAQQQTDPSAKKKRDLDITKEVPSAPEAATVHIPRSYALVIGIANYAHLPAKNQLLYPERDAEDIYEILISPEGGNFHAENVHRLLGPKATLANMHHEIEDWLPSVAQPDDRVLVYFAGHGFIYEGAGYLAPYDVEPDNVGATGYPMNTLGTVMGSKIRAKDKILLTDSCHSGAIKPDDVQNVNHALIDLNKSMFSFTASRDREVSFESPKWGGGHGIFTYYVVRGLEGEADENGDGIVTADELLDYVRRDVREATDTRQNPTVGPGSYDPQMLLAYVPSHAKPGVPPPAKEGGLVIEANMDGVEVFLDGKSMGVVNKDKALTLPGLAPGNHTVQGVKMGYEPDGPREETVYPGRDTTVSIRIMIARRRNHAAADALEKGLEYYKKGFELNYKKAAEQFQEALKLDPTYSQAALYLGRTYNALFDEQNAAKYFQQAIAIDPDYLEAHAGYGSMLLDRGDTDEAIRQFEAVLRREPKNVLALTNLAQAYRMKGLYSDSIESAGKAVKLAPEVAEPHLWMADSFRLSGKYEQSTPEYESYLRLSNFDSKLAGQLNYYVLGFLIGMGKKKRASQQDIWRDLRSLAYFGMCDSARKLKHFDLAITDCQKALTYDPADPYSHYALALAFATEGQKTGNCGLLAAALPHFRSTVQIDPDLNESSLARQNIDSIEKYLPQCP
jgi:tetratricopeptide (TPR) repeat protein